MRPVAEEPRRPRFKDRPYSAPHRIVAEVQKDSETLDRTHYACVREVAAVSGAPSRYFFFCSPTQLSDSPRLHEAAIFFIWKAVPSCPSFLSRATRSGSKALNLSVYSLGMLMQVSRRNCLLALRIKTGPERDLEKLRDENSSPCVVTTPKVINCRC